MQEFCRDLIHCARQLRVFDDADTAFKNRQPLADSQAEETHVASQSHGFGATPCAQRLRGVFDDMSIDGVGDATHRFDINDAPGKVVLVGHSWGGMVITEAGANDKVAGLVYVAAFAPEAGQNAMDVGKDFPPSPGIQKVAPDSEGYLYLPAEAVAEDFAQDLPARQTAVMAATQGPLNSKALGEKTSVAAWSSKPSWYIVSEKDRMIDPNLERALAKKIGAKVTSLPTSHVPQQSRPADVAKVIIAAVQASEK